MMYSKNEEESKAAKQEISSGDLSRRDLIGYLTKGGAGALAIALGGGLVGQLMPSARASEKKVKRPFHYGMVIDTRRCVGCKACVVACKAENKTPPGVSYNMVLDGALKAKPNGRPLFMTKPCFHCETPPCTDVCPVSATFKRKQDGIVVVDYGRCIGCRYCVTACPYGARSFDFGEFYPAASEGEPYAQVPSPEYNQFKVRKNHESPVGNVRKCNFCLHLQDENGRYDEKAGRWPSCTKTCTAKAIHFGDFQDTESEVSRLLRECQPIRLKEEMGTNSNVFYLL